MNWGYRIIILYAGFMGLIAILVIGSMKQKVDLVADDYYAQELKYQDHIDKMNRTTENNGAVKIELKDQTVIFEYPNKPSINNLEGTITFFRPSDSELDKEFSVASDSSGVQKIDAGQFKSGLYNVKVEYSMNGEDFYSENQLVIP